MKTSILMCLILLASCGKDSKTEVQTREMICINGYDGLICRGDNIHCEQFEYGELTCTYSYEVE